VLSSRKFWNLAAIGGVIAAVILASMVMFSRPVPPLPLPAVVDAAQAAARKDLPLPKLQRYVARDGAHLAYRSYPQGRTERPEAAVILVSGSGGSSVAMNTLGYALARAGLPAFAVDTRGQGQSVGRSGTRGDIDYIGQLEDDLEDFVNVVRTDHPSTPLVLLGHSSGGGFALRVAGGHAGMLFSRFVLLAPYLGPAAPTTRPNSGGWAHAAVPRIIALTVLDGVGIDAFNHLPVIAFALPPQKAGENTDDGLTRMWSYAMMRNFGPSDDIIGDAKKSRAPITLLAGSNDEVMIADRYAEYFSAVKDKVKLSLLPGVTHISILNDPAAVVGVVGAVKGN